MKHGAQAVKLVVHLLDVPFEFGRFAPARLVVTNLAGPAVDLALVIGAVKPEAASAIQALAVRLKSMLRALICRAQ